MKKILSFLLLFVSVTYVFAQTPSSFKISKCWKYSGVRATEDHSYGEELILWKIEKAVEGTFIFQCGASGSPVRASLEKVEFNEKSKKVSFSARYSSGLTMNKNTKQWEPAKDSVNFQGEIKNDHILGLLTFPSGQSCEKGPQYNLAMTQLSDCSDVEFEKRLYEDRRSESK